MLCSVKCKQYFVFTIGIILIVIGAVLLILWPTIFRSLIKSELQLTNDSKAFNMWKETPIPMYLKLYLFTCTNYVEFDKNRNIKPAFEQLGPYVFAEKHYRTNITWNSNYTLTFKQKRLFHFMPELSNGTLEDNITNINPITATVAYTIRKRHILIRHAVDFLLREKGERLFMTKTVKELLFDGYDDKLIDMVRDLNITGFNIPYDKFGWFYPRNNSIDYDGIFNMFTGVDKLSKTGMLHSWNYKTSTDAFESSCAMVNGTTGELWPPIGSSKSVTFFITDFCRSITLDYDSKYDKHGLVGRNYVGTDRLFDNGTLYPGNTCFNTGEALPSGVVNVSLCRYGAPAFVSYPHFYLADPIYRSGISGMIPNETIHQTHMALEPNTGIPLSVEAKMQINLMIQTYDGISLFNNLKRTLVPMLWFSEVAELSGDVADQAKLIILIPNLGNYTFYGVIGIGILIFCVNLYLTIKGHWVEKDTFLLKAEES